MKCSKWTKNDNVNDVKSTINYAYEFNEKLVYIQNELFFLVAFLVCVFEKCEST